jgi:hypothetical protein
MSDSKVNPSFLRKIGGAASFINQSLRSSIEEAPPSLRRGAKRLIVGAVSVFLIITVYRYVSFKREEAARAKELAAGPLSERHALRQSQRIFESGSR